MEFNIYLFVMIISSVCKASLSQDEQPKFGNATKTNVTATPTTSSCKATETEVTVTPTTLEDIMNFFSFEEDIPQIISDTVTVEIPILKESLLEPSVYDEDQDLNVTELITKYGFKPEVHEVTTKDGYELTIHRIVGNGPVVFMMHGILCSTDEWITAGADNSLALELAAAGYDVWIGNARGNKYSKKHISISPECDEFWEFSWDQISIIDVPTMIDYALNFTGKSNLSYVGFSQGTLNLVALCSEMPEYNEKISVAVLIAPAMYSSNWKSPFFRFFSVNPEALYKFTQFIGWNNLTPVNDVLRLITGLLCGNNPLSKIVCSNIAGIAFGYGRGQLNIAKLPVIFTHFPAGASMRQFIHYGQSGKTGKFQKFNFTKEKNLEVYGSEEPPQYKPEKVTVPVAVFYGEYDWVVNATDVKQLLNELPNVVNVTLLENFSHADHLWGKNCKQFLNEPVVEVISKYQN